MKLAIWVQNGFPRSSRKSLQLALPGTYFNHLSPFGTNTYIYITNIMPKRTSEAADLSVGKSAAKGQDTARPATTNEDDEMGEFEDKWEDEIESENEIEAEGGEDGEDGEDGEGQLAL